MTEPFPAQRPPEDVPVPVPHEDGDDQDSTPERAPDSDYEPV